ncbi:MAG: ComEA family DNA-binding protein, partial [Cellulomonadaceae bacterium]
EPPPVAAPAAGDSGAGGGAGAVAGGGADAGGVVDVNTADAGTLETLPGIGPVLARRIVEHREANGPFTSLESLGDVSGIGPSILARLDGLVRT